MAEQIRAFTGVGAGGVVNAVLRAGFSLANHPSVTISSAAAVGAKARVTDTIEPINWSPRARTGPGADGPRDRGSCTRRRRPERGRRESINDFKQTARGLTGSVQRAFDATTDKAEVTLTLDLVTEEMLQWAVVITDVPNQMLEDIAMLRQFLNTEMLTGIGVATDAHVIAQIIAAAPTATSTGGHFVETLRYVRLPTCERSARNRSICRDGSSRRCRSWISRCSPAPAATGLPGA